MESLGRISAAERQKKNKSRVSVFVDDAFFGSVDDVVWVRSGLKSGDTLPSALWQDMCERQEAQAALDRAVGYLEAQARSVAQVRRYLAQKGFSEAAAEGAIAKLAEYGYLDDGQYAQMLVRDRVNLKGAGRQAIARELKAQGVSPEEAAEALAKYGEEDELQAALKQAEKALRQASREADPKKRRAKVYASLARRGFGGDVITRALRALEGQVGEDD